MWANRSNWTCPTAKNSDWFISDSKSQTKELLCHRINCGWLTTYPKTQAFSKENTLVCSNCFVWYNKQAVKHELRWVVVKADGHCYGSSSTILLVIFISLSFVGLFISTILVCATEDMQNQ